KMVAPEFFFAEPLGQEDFHDGGHAEERPRVLPSEQALAISIEPQSCWYPGQSNDAVDLSAIHDCILHVCILQCTVDQSGQRENTLLKVDSSKVCPFEAGRVQFGPLEVGPPEVGPPEVGLADVGRMEV